MGELYGRGEDVAALDAVVADPSVLGAVIVGAPGIGKSALVRTVLDHASRAGAATVVGAATELANRLPFAPLAEALGLHPDSDEPTRAALGARLRGGVDGELDPGQFRWRVIDALLDEVERRTATTPLVLAIEDLHWADEDTLLALERVSQAAATLDLTVLATVRPPPYRAGVEAALSRFASGVLERFDLAVLDDEAVIDLATAHLGAPPDEQLVARLRAAGGNALLVTELLSNRGSGDLASAIDHRLEDLGPETIRSLGYAAVLGERFRPTDLAAVVGLTVGEAMALLQPALDNGVLTDLGEALAFRHALVRDHLYEQFGPAVRAALHRDVATALDAAGGSPDRVGPHLLAAPPDPPIVTRLVELAGDIVDRAPEAAARWAEHAARHAANGDVTHRARLVQARALALGGRPGSAVETLRPLLHATADPVARAGLAETITLAQLLAGSIDAAVVDVLTRALADLGSEDHHRQRVIAALGLDLSGKRDEALGLADEVIASAAPGPGPKALALALRGRTHFDRGDIASMESDFAAAMALVTSANVAAEWTGAQALILTASALGPSAPFEQVLRQVLVAAERQGYPTTTASLQGLLANTLAWHGQWAEAEVQARAALDGLEATSLQASFGAWEALIMMCTRRGDLDGLLGAPPADTVADDTPARRALGMSEARAVAAIRGDEEGWEVAQATRDAWRSAGLAWPYVHGLPYVSLALRVGHTEDAGSFVTVTAEASRATGQLPFFEAVVDAMHAVVEDDADAARRAVDNADEAPPFPVRMDVLLAAGEVLSRHDEDTAIDVLTEARRLAVDADATLDLAQADALLRDLGVIAYRARPKATTGWDALTETEARIVPLVAEGLVYREIGERLFISRRTVETHVANVFRKIGVRSRRDLARAYLDDFGDA